MFLVKDPSKGATIGHCVGPEIVDIGVTCAEGIAVMTVTGEMDVSNAGWLYECLHDAMDAGIFEIVVDVAHLTYMDSTGLSVLVGANRRMQCAGGTLTILSPVPIVTKLLSAAHLVPALNVLHRSAA
jgi:anti-anti-sigma factor